MIVDGIINVLLFFPNLLLDNLNFISNISIPDSVINWWNSTLSVLTYLFPINALIPIFAISFGVKTFQITWALINKIKGWIPTMSD